MEEEEEAPILRLEILQGPRQGETLEFKPRSAVRIGRVVKGNTLPIKDPGISSKHLSILTESNKWVLRDLDSSNGTVLNGSSVPPNTPFTLHHDSTIKIGELTSIHVLFLQPPAQSTLPLPPAPRARGRPRARGAKGRVQPQSFDQNGDASVLNAEPARVPAPARVTRRSNRERSAVRVCDDAPEEKGREEPKSMRDPSLIEVSDSSVGNLDVPVEEPKKSRVKRNLKTARAVAGSVEGGVENVEKMKSKGAAGKRELLQKEVEGGRENENVNSVVRVCEDALGEKVEEQYKSTRKPSLVEVSDSSVGNMDVPMEEPKKARAKRNLKTARAVAGSVECGVEKMKSKGATGKRELLQKEVEAGRENENVNSVVRVCDDAPGEKVEEHKSTRNRSLVEVSDSSVGNLDAPVEEPKNTRLTRNPKNARAVTGNVEKKKSDGVTEKRELLQKEVGDGRKKEKVNSDDGNWPDLNNMTLGEWFDFLEVHLPKQIIDETEEIIDSMMQKAVRLREYIAEMQPQNDKGKMPMEE